MRVCARVCVHVCVHVLMWKSISESVYDFDFGKFLIIFQAAFLGWLRTGCRT